MPNFKVEPLLDHDRAAFSCGVESLDEYFARRASQDVKRNLAAVFVMIEAANPRRPIGYFTLSNRQIDIGDLPPGLQKKVGRYKHVPATLIGRLAVDKEFKGKKLGEALLIEALKLAYENRKQVGSFGVLVEAEEEAVGFYLRYGFIQLSDRVLFLNMQTVHDVIHG
jgi:GNAT superfamily N-acetyltransferase